MPRQTLERRVDGLEQRVTSLEALPGRMDRLELQIVQLRAEMRDEFSAIRGGIQAGDGETRRVLREEIRVGDEETRRVLREEIRVGDEETRRVLREEIRMGDEETRRVLRDEIRAGDEETRQVLRDEIRETTDRLFDRVSVKIDEAHTRSRVLFEEALSRIATINEGNPSRRRKKP